MCLLMKSDSFLSFSTGGVRYMPAIFFLNRTRRRRWKINMLIKPSIFFSPDLGEGRRGKRYMVIKPVIFSLEKLGGARC